MSTTVTRRVNGSAAADITPRVADADGETTFQTDAFQVGAFQMGRVAVTTRRVDGEKITNITKRVA